MIFEYTLKILLHLAVHFYSCTFARVVLKLPIFNIQITVYLFMRDQRLMICGHLQLLEICGFFFARTAMQITKQFSSVRIIFA